ncbi:hypothetical protein B566_EDAN016477 [Ephemera danica]|nr:hypothetical protein B566_EDAN016477 [Ephemera danica]
MFIKSWLILLLGFKIDCMLACRKDAKEIGICLHRYLERDFLSIEMVVYPKSGDSKRTLLLEGPKLENDCHIADPTTLHAECVETDLQSIWHCPKCMERNFTFGKEFLCLQGYDICANGRQLMEQRTCLVNEGHISGYCGDKAHQVYAELSDVFFSSWCSAGDRPNNNVLTVVTSLIFLTLIDLLLVI